MGERGREWKEMGEGEGKGKEMEKGGGEDGDRGRRETDTQRETYRLTFRPKRTLWYSLDVRGKPRVSVLAFHLI